MPSRSRKFVGGFQRLLPPWGVRVSGIVGKGVGLGVWPGFFLEAGGVPSKSVSSSGVCVWSRVYLSRSNLIEDTLVNYMLPTSSSTIIHSLLRSRDRQQTKIH